MKHPRHPRRIHKYLPRNQHAYSLWTLRFLLIWGCVTAIAAPGPRAVLGPPRQVETASEQLCVHTRLIDEVFEWKIQHTLELVREMGAGTIVEFFPWAYIEHQPGQYNWKQADKIIRHAENQGIQVIARLGFVPAWAQPPAAREQATLNYLADEAFDEFAAFAARFAQRYAGVVDHIIIWNEPNLAFEWGYREVDAADYVRLLRTVYSPLKQANPDVTVLAGALAPTLEPRSSPHGLNDVIYLEDMYRAGAAAYFDALAVHTYGFTQPPEAPPAPDELNFRRVELLRDIMVRYDDANTPVYITESGWNDHPRWTKAVRPSRRTAYTVDSLVYAEENWPWLEELCLWAFRYPAPTNSYPDHFTFVTPAFERKPVYYAVQAYAREQDGQERSRDYWLPPPQPSDG